MRFYVPTESEDEAFSLVENLPEAQRPERWNDGSYCRQAGHLLTWPLERHGAEGRQIPSLRLFAEPRCIVVAGQARDVVQLVMVPATRGWTREEYPLPAEWAAALAPLRLVP
jgi:hypothetical protein